ncbi:MAG: NAD-dependent epimerase/dehydratase family protein, partial [Granulosicoccus sp.]|nr:NAD-dependent epimerase/dehydratase family protein [Granulosicoccus sp.]
MKILIIGAAGMIGRKLTKRLLEAEAVDHLRPSTLMLADIAAPSIDESTHQSSIITPVSIDLSDETAVKKLVANRPDVIFQLAAIVSAEAEANMPKGYRVNLDGMRYLLEAIAAQHSLDGYKPKFIFASSIAVYGAPFPEAIGDEFHQTPMTSYGTQKAMGELLLADYNRRSFIEGIGLRLPTICVRPGKPNKAASGFFSNIIREPINGQSAQLPV